MKRRMYNESVVHVKTERATYYVVYKRLNNGVNGNPRYEFRIINADAQRHGGGCAIVYRASGHYIGDDAEARWIIEQYEAELLEGV